MAMLYSHSIGNQLYNAIVEFKMRDSVPSARYSRVLLYYVNEESGSSLLIESIGSTIYLLPMRNKGYCSCPVPVCVCMFVSSFMRVPRHRNNMYGFTATRAKIVYLLKILDSETKASFFLSA